MTPKENNILHVTTLPAEESQCTSLFTDIQHTAKQTWRFKTERVKASEEKPVATAS